MYVWHQVRFIVLQVVIYNTVKYIPAIQFVNGDDPDWAAQFMF